MAERELRHVAPRECRLLPDSGIGGTIAGIGVGKVLGTRKELLERGFAAAVIVVGGYLTASSL
jgi:hypothetical protein